MPIFPGMDNEDSPKIRRIVNPANGMSIPSAHLPEDDEEISPSLLSHICDRLGFLHDSIKLDCNDGSSVSVKVPDGGGHHHSSASAEVHHLTDRSRSAAKRASAASPGHPPRTGRK